MPPKQKKSPPAAAKGVPCKDPASLGAPSPNDELTEELTAIYGPAGEAGDMDVMEKTSDSKLHHALIGLVVFFGVLAAVSWAGFFLFSPAANKFNGERVELSIDGNAGVTSGELTTYVVKWKNNERMPLGTASLEVHMPAGFTVKSTAPSALSGLTWRLGAIGTEKDGSVSITGVMLAPASKELDIQAILTYRPADFNSEFQKVATRTVTVTDSVLTVGPLTGPTKALPGDKITYVIPYENRSKDSSFSQVKVRAIYPSGFVPDTTDPAASDDVKSEWTIDKLDAGAKGSIKVAGTYASDAKGPQEVKVQIGFVGDNQSFVLQKEAAMTTDVLEGDLLTALVLNGRSDTQAVNFGDTLRYAVTYRNSGTNTLGDVSLSVVFDAAPPQLLAWGSLSDKKHGIRDGNSLTWTKKQTSGLEKIAPGDEGTLQFELPIIDRPLASVKDTAYHVSARVEATIGTIDGDKVGRTVTSQPVDARVQSDTSFSAEARYFTDNGEPLGSGPLPPTVGQTTTYHVIWTVKNTFHDLSALKVSAKLPDGVAWNGKSSVDAGNLSYDAAAGKMVWMLNWMPTSITSLTIGFDVAIAPTADQIGKIPVLTDSTILEATDKVTGLPVLLSQPQITTALENDAQASGKGRVVAQ